MPCQTTALGLLEPTRWCSVPSNKHNQSQPATTSAYDYLVRALQLLEQPRYISPSKLPYSKVADHSWIRNAEAYSDILGSWVAPEDERATCWCTIGVIKAVTKYDPDPEAAYRYCLSIMNAANPAYVAVGSQAAQPTLNDQAESFDTVRKYFQRSIALAHKWAGRIS
jgi:hypothetical protein